MRSEIARQHRPKAVPFGPTHLHSRLPRVPQHAGPTRQGKAPPVPPQPARPAPGPDPLIRAPLEVLGPEPLATR
eukprot:7017929-Prymnesium_polylepis.1